MLSRAKSQQCRILARVFERAGKDEAIARLKEETR